MKHFLLLTFLFLTSLAKANDGVNFTLICPPDVTVDCNAELWDLSIYGNAQYHDYSGYHSAGYPVVSYHLTNCGTGYITRTWSVEDPYWNIQTCTQTITVGSNGQFNQYYIHWPQATVTLEGCSPDVNPDITGRPTWEYLDCSLIGWSFKDQIFYTNDACKKILRKWTLIDWCNYTGYNNYGTYTFTQVIKIVNNIAPAFTCAPDITVSSQNCKNAWVTSKPVTITDTQCSAGVIITNNSPYAQSNGPDISGQYPVGVTKVTMTLRYGCGGVKTCLILVNVKSDKPPVPICYSSIAIPLMGMDTNGDGVNDQGSVDLWAKDLNFKSESTCGFNPLKFSFSSNPADASRTFTCEDIGKNDVKMYVFDSKGNYDFCVVTVDVQNNAANIENCEPTPDPNDRYTVSGRLSGIYNNVKSNKTIALYDPTVTYRIDTTITETYSSHLDSFVNIAGVTLYYQQADTTFTMSIDTITIQGEVLMRLSDKGGKFSFDTSMVRGSSRVLQVIALETEMEKIDRHDVDLLTSYLIDPTVFKYPYQYIAADVNRDKVIDVDDLSMLISYLSGEIESFGPDSWIPFYMDKDIMAHPSTTLRNFKNYFQIDSVTQHQLGINFQLVQLGDISTFQDEVNIQGSDIDLNNRTSSCNDLDAVTTVYPNPFSKNLNLKLNSSTGTEANLSLLDATGRILLSRQSHVTIGSNEISINTETIAPGVIIYKIEMNDKVFTGRVLKID